MAPHVLNKACSCNRWLTYYRWSVTIRSCVISQLWCHEQPEQGAKYPCETSDCLFVVVIVAVVRATIKLTRMSHLFDAEVTRTTAMVLQIFWKGALTQPQVNPIAGGPARSSAMSRVLVGMSGQNKQPDSLVVSLIPNPRW